MQFAGGSSERMLQNVRNKPEFQAMDVQFMITGMQVTGKSWEVRLHVWSNSAADAQKSQTDFRIIAHWLRMRDEMGYSEVQAVGNAYAGYPNSGWHL